MDWKEFFKPTWGKIVLWFGLFLILPAYIPLECVMERRGTLCPEFAYGAGGIIAMVTLPNSTSAIISAIPYIVLMLLIPYMISCFFISIYNSLKPKSS